MYKCTDCKSEYEQKPEYCDCGNNLFEETATVKTSSIKDFPSEQERLKTDIDNKNTEGGFLAQYPKINKCFKSIDVLSGSIFVVCIILSIFAWLFIGSGPAQKHQAKKQVIKTQQTKITKIPKLDSFWNDTLPKQKQEDTENSPEINVTSQPQQFSEPQTQRISQPIAPEFPQMRPKHQMLPRFNEPKNFTPRFNPPQMAQPHPQVSKPIAPKIHNKTSNDNNMNRYKSALRQLLFSHLAVASIQGSGKCQIEFAIAPSGKLLGRKFSQLSDNKSLNDAVYNMLMSVPQYYPPPSDYKGEKIRLTFSFDNGYYEVSY